MKGELFRNEGLNRIQRRKKTRSSAATSFAERMYHGRTKEALELLKGNERGGTLNMFDLIPSGSGDVRYVRDVLLEKHPPGQPTHPDSLLQNETPPIHPVIFDSIDSDLIRTATLRTSGSAGLSGLDARVWRRIYAHAMTLLPETCVKHLLE